MLFEQAPGWARHYSSFHGEGEVFLVLCTTSDDVIDVTKELAQATSALDYDTNGGYDDEGNLHWIGVTCV